MSNAVIILLIAATAGYLVRWTSPASLFATLFSAGIAFFAFFVIIADRQTAIMLSIAVLVGILMAEVLTKRHLHRRR